MRLLHTQSHKLRRFDGDDTPEFAVFSSSLAKDDAVSHTNSTCQCGIEQPIANDVIRACKEANDRGINYLWLYSYCVDKSSSADVDEAINASFRWLRKATICFAYLDDLQSNEPTLSEDSWKESVYWKNPWTLQEIIGPKCVEFYDTSWKHLGSKSSPELLPLISNITGIPKNILLDSQQLWSSAIAMRIAWASDRQGHREEDVAYSLVGLTGVSMSSRYGEGAQGAFSRLQKKILKETTDGSIFAWRSKNETEVRGVLAKSPSEFRQFVIANGRGRQIPWIFDGLIRQNNRGIEIRSRVSRLDACLLLEIGRRGENVTQCERIGIWLREWNGVYVRVNPTSIVKVPEPGAPFTINLSRHIDSKLSNIIKLQFDREKQANCQPTPQTRNSQSPSPPSDAEALPRTKFLAPVMSGVKRDRSGKPKLHLGDSQKVLNKYVSPLTTPSVYSPKSANAGDECSPSNCRNSPAPKAEEEVSLSKNTDLEHKALEVKQEFESLMSGMTRFCYSRMQEWMRAEQSNMHLEDTLTPRKRVKTEDKKDEIEKNRLEKDNIHAAIGGTEGLSKPAVELVDEFWSRCGRECVEKHLLEFGSSSEDFENEEKLTELSLLALQGLREMAISGVGAEKLQDQQEK